MSVVFVTLSLVLCGAGVLRVTLQVLHKVVHNVLVIHLLSFPVPLLLDNFCSALSLLLLSFFLLFTTLFFLSFLFLLLLFFLLLLDVFAVCFIE